MNIDDLLFKFKNKDYGAYYLRRKYTATLFISLVITLTLVVVFLIVPLFLNIKKQENNEFIINLNISTAELSLIENLIEEEPEIKKQNIPKEEPLPENKEEEQNVVNTVDSAVLAKMQQDSILNAQKEKESIANSDTALKSVAEFDCGGDLISFRTWFIRNYKYPKKQKKISGKLSIQFSVNLNGIIDSVLIIQGVDPNYDLEAKKLLLNSPRWSPCYIANKQVRMFFNLPIIIISQ